MSTAEDAGATANTTTSSYGGGGAGGKFRKKPFRRPTTPYDRPPTPLRGNITNSDDSSSWLTKLVVEPASKLISYGADRFFASVFRRRLPPPLPPQPPEENAQESDGDQGAGLNSQGGEQEPRSGQCSQPIISSTSNGVTELEHLLKQKTFTRSEIAHLTGLLQSRAAEGTPGDTSQINVLSTVDSGRQKEFTNCVSEGNRNDGTFTPIQNSKVLENDIASPAELAKAYMGRRPSQVSPSVLGMRNQLGKEGTGLLSDTLIASKSPIMSLAKKTSFSLVAAENGFITPRSRGRSAIYNMARTPYSRVHPTSILKGSGINNYAGPSTSSSSLSPVEKDENFDSRLVTLKRRSSVLDDEIGSVGPMRRIRQKPNLLASRFHHTAHGVGIVSHAKQKPQLNGEETYKVLKNSVENENESVPSTSYAHVPSKSREVAAKILQQLEKFSPKEKSSESKLAAVQEKSPSKSISSRLPGQALRNMEAVGSSKLLLNVQDDHKSGNKTNGTLPDANDSSPRTQGKAEETDPIVSIIPSGRWNPTPNNDSAVSLKASAPGIGATGSVVKNGTSQPQKKRAFRMSAEEDSLEHDDVECNGLASRPLSENKGPIEFQHPKPAEKSKTTSQSEDKSFFGLISRGAREHSPGAVTFGQGTSAIAIPSPEGTRATSQSQIFAPSVPLFDKPKEANSSHMFGFSSKAADKFPSLASESIKRAESEPERSSSFATISTSIDSEVKTPESDTGFHLNPVKAVDTNGKCDDVSPATLNGPSVSFPAASFSDMNRMSTGSAPLFTSSTCIANFVPTGNSSAVLSSSSIFGSAAKFSSLVETVPKDGSSVDLSTAVSAAPTASFSEIADQRAKIDINPSSGSSTTNSYSTVAASAAASSGNSLFKLGSSFSNSTGNTSVQGSLFASATKSPVPVAGTISQGTSIGSVSAASIPAFSMNTSGSLGSLPTPSISFGSGSLTPSSDTTSLVPAVGPTSSVFKLGETPTPVSSSTNATSSPFGFGFSSSSSSINTVGSSSGPAAAIFSFGGASVSASAITTASSLSSGTSAGIFGFGGSSSGSSSASNLVSSNSGASSNVFGSGWQSSKPAVFGSSFASASPSSTGFSFSASANAGAPVAFNSSIGASSGPVFSFTTASASALSSPSLPSSQPMFGNPPIGGGFGASPGNNDQMNAEDSMAEDPVSSSASTPLFGQPSFPPTFAFGSSAPPQNSPFMFNGQQNQVPPQNPSPFQASSSVEFNGGGGSFSLGSSGGVDKSGRKIVKINRNKNRKK
ncbi:hypothetical protein C2S53_014723 [Perilla frutescens var. hirtella]|uniref:Nuclear pore complex protein NUP1-like n=1 Tax=Perilla frutescens var. hirtella TaxID=608512 RepID=A0AAD4P5B8_PERFH|nr:hypothetical protein C2S53_014723 [Perilla frutescens var. hirtella]